MLEQNKSFTQFFSKNCGFPKGKALGCLPQKAKPLSFKRIFERSKGALLGCRRQFCPILYGQKSKLQVENLFSIHFSASEKVFKNRLCVESNLKNYPVDDF